VYPGLLLLLLGLRGAFGERTDAAAPRRERSLR
jgi:hypothetical protein